MSPSENSTPKNPTSHLHALNLIVALLAGVVSITGGIFTLKTNLFSSQQYGSLQGTVRDEKIAKPLLLTAVEVSGTDGAVVNTVNTDENGQYRIEAVKTGNYVIKFIAPRHVVQTKTVKIEKDLTSTVNVDLVPEEQPSVRLPLETVPQNARSVYSSGAFQNPAPTTSSMIQQGSGTVATSAVSNIYMPAQKNMLNQQTTSSMHSQSYGQETERSGFPEPPPPPRVFSHRGRHSAYDGLEDNSSNASQSQGSALAEVGMQLLQNYMVKKGENNSSS
ncbi:MAG TPA: carboxypeptidase-like regulatory domain-containing protein [Candidatus Omnitrophota bacterium]|nr:carboxypeptidase-like regulatory domain-containing protein [Candidatus Omnitrophota bacterium]